MTTRDQDAEYRHLPFQGVELRELAAGSGLEFTGYASVTDSPYEIESMFGSYQETIVRGAFRVTLEQKADVNFLLNHDGVSMARTKSGTLQLSEDSTGLHVRASLDPKNPRVAEMRSGIDRGDLDEMSFGFRATRQAWNDDETQRDILEVNMTRGGDVSVVNFGANPATAGHSAILARRMPTILEALREGRELDETQSALITRLLAADTLETRQIVEVRQELITVRGFLDEAVAEAMRAAQEQADALTLRRRRLLALSRLNAA